MKKCVNWWTHLSESPWMCLVYFLCDFVHLVFIPSIWEYQKTDMRVCIHLHHNIVIAWVVLAHTQIHTTTYTTSWTPSPDSSKISKNTAVCDSRRVLPLFLSTHFPSVFLQINNHIGSVSHISMVTDGWELSRNKPATVIIVIVSRMQNTKHYFYNTNSGLISWLVVSTGCYDK